MYSPLSGTSLHFCNMIIKERCVPCDLRKPLTYFEFFFHIIINLCVERIRLLNFDACRNKLTVMRREDTIIKL